MATGARKGSAYTQSTGLSGTDYVMAIANVSSVPNNAPVTVTNLFANSNVPHVTVGNNAMSSANLVVRPLSNIPTTTSFPGVQGQIVWSNTFIYVCIANNTWARAALSTSF
jgi:hypothetical protein